MDDEPHHHHRHGPVLGASASLLGIALGLIAALRLTDFSGKSLGDEVAWGAAMMFLLNIVDSFLALKSVKLQRWRERFIDIVFLTGVGLLTLATALIGLAER